MMITGKIGVVGGGQLGGALIRGWLRAGLATPQSLRIATRSGRITGFDDWPDLAATQKAQDLADTCDIIVLAVPPGSFADLVLHCPDALVISVMAGVSAARIADQTSATRIIRAMSNPAADSAMAYSPFCPCGATDADADTAQALFAACGLTDQVGTEDQIDHFTALTGPVPGFVAGFADAMVRYATQNGIDAGVANRAICQLFAASGAALSQSEASPATHVADMMAYAGTTAAGLQAMQAAGLTGTVAKGLDAAYQRTKTIAYD